jgi:glutamate racemase
MDTRPIGIFDSGLGGLTVLKELMLHLPSESIIYFGDSGRAPYGTKSSDTIRKFAFQDVRFLMSLDIKMLVIACNTASAHSYEAIRDEFNIPVVEVVRPGAVAGVNETVNNRVGVIGTSATIASGVYDRAIKSLDTSIHIVSKACPLFVNLVEEGWWDNEVAFMTASQYLQEFKGEDIDTLILGCTHYPLLGNTIAKVVGSHVRLVSSANEVAKAVRDMIYERSIQADDSSKAFCRYYTSDSVDKFKELGGLIFEKEIGCVEKVDIDKY